MKTGHFHSSSNLSQKRTEQRWYEKGKKPERTCLTWKQSQKKTSSHNFSQWFCLPCRAINMVWWCVCAFPFYLTIFWLLLLGAVVVSTPIAFVIAASKMVSCLKCELANDGWMFHGKEQNQHTNEWDKNPHTMETFFFIIDGERRSKRTLSQYFEVEKL